VKPYNIKIAVSFTNDVFLAIETNSGYLHQS